MYPLSFYSLEPYKGVVAKTKLIQIRVSNNQFLRIKNNALAKGHVTISAYLRQMGLSNDLAFEMKVDEIYKIMPSKISENTHIFSKNFWSAANVPVLKFGSKMPSLKLRINI